MDLGELQVFLTVAKEGSFSRAAERLYRTQPAVSLAIRKLEDGLGQPLFVRGSRPVRMTDAGTLLKDYAERLINLRDEVKKGLTELEGLERGELSLGVNESSIHALLPALAIFREKHPGVQVRVHRMFSRDIPHEVLNYRLDLGAVSYVPRDPQLQATEILKDELALVVPPKHPLARKREVDITDLGRETFIAHIVESPFRRRVIELFARHHTELNMPIEMPTIESIKALRADGHGCGHRAAHVCAMGNRARLDERSESEAAKYSAPRVLGRAERRTTAARRRGTDAHPARGPFLHRVSTLKSQVRYAKDEAGLISRVFRPYAPGPV